MKAKKSSSAKINRKNILNPRNLIPPEIVDAFEIKDTGYNILLKGKAGAGKTTFALTLLDVFKDFEPIYLSTRVAPLSLFTQFPWLKKRLKPENIIDATRTYIPPANRPDPDGSLMKAHLMRTIRFSSIPEFLKIVYEKIAQFENPIIVIDSWDAIMGQDGENKENIETLFSEFVRQTNAKLILIAESDEVGFLDYIVDGIFTIRDDSVDGRTIRTIEVNKIRAIERKQKEYVFTLFNNKFQYCKPFHDVKPIDILPWKTTPDSNDLFSTGNKSLDQLYHGGFKQGTFNLLEVESNVPITSYSSIVIAMICNYIQQDRGIIVHTTDGINSELIDKKRLFLHLKTDSISKNMRILMEKLSDRNEIRPYITQIDKKNFNEVFFDTYAKLSSITKFQPVFATISYNTLTFMVDFNKAIRQFDQHITKIRNSNVIELGIINSTRSNINASSPLSTLTNDISYVADTHLKIFEQNGAIFIYGIKPRTQLYYMENDFSLGYPQIKLIPIV